MVYKSSYLVFYILTIWDCQLENIYYKEGEKEGTLCVRGNRPNSARVNILRQMTMNGHKKKKGKKEKRTDSKHEIE